MTEPERMRILEMLEQGTITSAEAADLLSALDEQPREDGRSGRLRAVLRERNRWTVEDRFLDRRLHERARFFRVRVTEGTTGRTRANIAIPLQVLGFSLGVVQRLRVPGARHIDEILDAVRAGRRGTLFDVCGQGDERVEIIIE